MLTADFLNVTSKKVAAKASFTMQQLRKQAMWGMAAAAALLIAVIASSSEVGSQRAAGALASLNLRSSQTAAQTTRGPDLEVVTRQLMQAVRGLSEDRNQIMSRLAAVEHNLDDVTGSIEAVAPPSPVA